MNEEHRFRTLERIFHGALGLDPAQRSAFLDQACLGDPDLRAEVEGRLAHAQGDSMQIRLHPDAGCGSAEDESPRDVLGSRIGRYKLLQEIGEGSSGVGYMAEQEEPVCRKVALKIIKLGMDTRQVIARFERTLLAGANKNDHYERALPFFGWEPGEDEDPELVARADRILDQEKRHRMSPFALRGRNLFFGKAQSNLCHAGENLTDELFHNIVVGFEGEVPDLGRYRETEREEDRGAFKTPTLRDVALTDPYMHDGSLPAPMNVVERYDGGGTDNAYLEPPGYSRVISSRFVTRSVVDPTTRACR